MNGLVWPVIFTGAVSGVLCAIGLIPPYLELWKRNGQVVGICKIAEDPAAIVLTSYIGWMFLGIDLTGAFLSLLAIGWSSDVVFMNLPDTKQWHRSNLISWEACCILSCKSHNVEETSRRLTFGRMVLEGVICISHGVWALRNRNLQKQARAATLDFDDLEQARNANAPEFTPLRAVLKRGKNLDLLPLQEPHLTRLGVETRLEP